MEKGIINYNDSIGIRDVRRFSGSTGKLPVFFFCFLNEKVNFLSVGDDPEM